MHYCFRSSFVLLSVGLPASRGVFLIGDPPVVKTTHRLVDGAKDGIVSWHTSLWSSDFGKRANVGDRYIHYNKVDALMRLPVWGDDILMILGSFFWVF